MTSLSILLLATTAAGQLTTSFFLPQRFLGTDRITYVASAIGADKDRVTLAIHPINDTDYEGLGLQTDLTQTITFASTLYEFSTSDLRGAESISGQDGYHAKCEMQETASEATCTLSFGQDMAQRWCIPRPSVARPARTETQLWTFSDTDTAGVETIVRTLPPGNTSPLPDYCTEGTDFSVPTSELQREEVHPRDYFGTYEIIITAGEEKVSATTGGAATITSAPVTTTSVNTVGDGTINTGGTIIGSLSDDASPPMRTMVPALAGLGAAAAVFL